MLVDPKTFGGKFLNIYWYSILPNKRQDQNNQHGTFLANSKQQKLAALRHFYTVF